MKLTKQIGLRVRLVILLLLAFSILFLIRVWHYFQELDQQMQTAKVELLGRVLNDTHGHVAGDLLLQQSAQRISKCVRETDTVGRFGGDEFVVVLGPLVSQHVESAVLAKAIAEKFDWLLVNPTILH